MVKIRITNAALESRLDVADILTSQSVQVRCLKERKGHKRAICSSLIYLRHRNILDTLASTIFALNLECLHIAEYFLSIRCERTKTH